MTQTDIETKFYLTLSDNTITAALLADAINILHPLCVRLDLTTNNVSIWEQTILRLAPVCHEAGIAVIVRNHINLVEEYGLDGVHLTNGAANIVQVRTTLGKDKSIGAYAGVSRHRGMLMAEQGADYVSFGPVWCDPALSNRPVVETDVLAWWQEMIEIPVVAEGGMSPEIATPLMGVADFVAIDPENWHDPETLEVLRAYTRSVK